MKERGPSGQSTAADSSQEENNSDEPFTFIKQLREIQEDEDDEGDETTNVCGDGNSVISRKRLARQLKK